jgi:ankyrin repeat protein
MNKRQKTISFFVDYCREGHIDMVKEFLKSDDPSDNNNKAIIEACRYRQIEIVKVLLNDKRVDPSANNNYELRWACENCHVEIVKILLSDSRVDPSANNNDAIRLACRYV